MSSELDMVAMATDLAYQDLTVGDLHELMPGYSVDWVFGDQWSNTGFYAAGFANEALGHHILAIRGSQDRLDVIADAELGLHQYERNRDPLIDYVGMHILGNRITIAGHSLGGCLSQYLGYECAGTFSASRENLGIHTHNSLGGLLGIARMMGETPSPAIDGVTIRNYRHPADPVSRLGGQLGGKVFVLPPTMAGQGSLKFVHSNKRFLPVGEHSVLTAAEEEADLAFHVAGTLLAAGPDMARALDELWQDHQSLAAAREMFRALAAVPADERGSVLAIAAGLLPFGRLGTLLAGFRRDHG